ncbi:MAG TPA: hypothetical protein VKZ94_10250 [Advenella sp.]|nr:hypothetical protein [Advenella sp.]
MSRLRITILKKIALHQQSKRIRGKFKRAYFFALIESSAHSTLLIFRGKNLTGGSLGLIAGSGKLHGIDQNSQRNATYVRLVTAVCDFK